MGGARVKAKRSTRNLAKTLLGVAVILAIAVLAGTAAYSTLSSILNPNHQTRLQRYTSRGNDVLVTLGVTGVQVAFPSEPTISTEEVHLFFATVKSQRRISVIDDDAVEAVWYKLPDVLRGQDDLLRTLGTVTASDLRGVMKDVDVHAESRPPALQFWVPAPAGQKGDYHVRIMIHDNYVFVLRVRASVDGPRALNYFANSFCTDKATCLAPKA